MNQTVEEAIFQNLTIVSIMFGCLLTALCFIAGFGFYSVCQYLAFLSQKTSQIVEMHKYLESIIGVQHKISVDLEDLVDVTYDSMANQEAQRRSEAEDDEDGEGWKRR